MRLSSRSRVHSSNRREGGRPRARRALGPPRSESQPFARAARAGHQRAPAPLASRFRGARAVSRRVHGGLSAARRRQRGTGVLLFAEPAPCTSDSSVTV